MSLLPHAASRDVALSPQDKYSQSAVVDFWTQFAESGLQAAEAVMLARYAPPPPAQVLDIGCGAGRVTLALAPRGYRVTGLDITLAMVEAAHTLVLNHGLVPDFAQGDLRELPFRDGSFDIALVFIAALQHVQGRAQRQNAFWQMARILREGGVLLIALDNVAPALSCYASWAAQKVLNRKIRPAANEAVSHRQSEVSHASADKVLTANRSRMSAIGWRARGLARTLRWRTWEGVRDAGRRLHVVGGETGDTFIEQVSMPPTTGRVYYHLYRHAELLADAHVAGLRLLGYHSANELAEHKTFGRLARRLDKQVLYAFSR